MYACNLNIRINENFLNCKTKMDAISMIHAYNIPYTCFNKCIAILSDPQIALSSSCQYMQHIQYTMTKKCPDFVSYLCVKKSTLIYHASKIRPQYILQFIMHHLTFLQA